MEEPAYAVIVLPALPSGPRMTFVSLLDVGVGEYRGIVATLEDLLPFPVELAVLFIWYTVLFLPYMYDIWM